MNLDPIHPHDIATLLGVGRRYFVRTIEKRPDFVKPALRFSRKTRVYHRPDVMAWIEKVWKR